jgi:hypothetical protein
VESFADNLFMITLIQLCVVKGWYIQLSSKELDTSVLDSTESAFFAGFIAAASCKETGTYAKGTTKYSKGVASYQTFCVEKKFGKVNYLRTGGMDNLLLRLSQMKGFTKDYWSLRGTLAAIFKSIDPVPVTDLKSYMLPKNEVMKHIKTKLPYENGGLFRTEEIAYLGERYATKKQISAQFMLKLDNPTEQFIIDFDKEYAPVKTAFESVEREVKLLAVNRSKLLFPTGTKKSQLKFKSMNINDKLSTLDEEKLRIFEPESLPGISKSGKSDGEVGTTEWMEEVYKISSANTQGTEVITSWYNYYSEQD